MHPYIIGRPGPHARAARHHPAHAESRRISGSRPASNSPSGASTTCSRPNARSFAPPRADPLWRRETRRPSFSTTAATAGAAVRRSISVTRGARGFQASADHALFAAQERERRTLGGRQMCSDASWSRLRLCVAACAATPIGRSDRRFLPRQHAADADRLRPGRRLRPLCAPCRRVLAETSAGPSHYSCRKTCRARAASSRRNTWPRSPRRTAPCWAVSRRRSRSTVPSAGQPKSTLRTFRYIGRVTTNIDAGAALASVGIKSFDDVRSKQYTVGASGGGSTTVLYPVRPQCLRRHQVQDRARLQGHERNPAGDGARRSRYRRRLWASRHPGEPSRLDRKRRSVDHLSGGVEASPAAARRCRPFLSSQYRTRAERSCTPSPRPRRSAVRSLRGLESRRSGGPPCVLRSPT